MMKSTVIKIVGLSLLLMILVSPLRAFNIELSSAVGFISYLFLTVYLLNKFGQKIPGWLIFVGVIAGLWVFHLPLRIIYFRSTLTTLPDALIHTLGIVCAYLYWLLKGRIRLLPVVLGCLITAFMFFQGYDMWLHKLNYGTFTGRIQPLNLPAKFEAKNEYGQLITDAELSGKIVLLDFWHTRCGICFEKFPQVQAAYERYRTDPSINILAVNKPLEEDRPGDAFEMIKTEGYSFQVVVSKDEYMPENFGVRVYPTTFVIDRKGEVVFKGGIEGAVKMVEELRQTQ